MEEESEEDPPLTREEQRLIKQMDRIQKRRNILKRPSNEMNKVFVVHPAVRSLESLNASQYTRMYQLEEAAGLIEAVTGWEAVAGRIIAFKSVHPDLYFARGAFKKVGAWLKEVDCSAVMVNCQRLSVEQHGELKEAWGCPVYDRLTVVLNIFKERARTREAKLQVRGRISEWIAWLDL